MATVTNSLRRSAKFAAAALIAGVLACAPVASAQTVMSSGAPSSTMLAIRATTSVKRVSSAGKVIPPANGAYIGVFRDQVPVTTSPLDSFKKSTGKAASIVMWYQQWGGSYTDFQSSAVKKLLRRGQIPMITWEPWDPEGNPSNQAVQPKYRLKYITRGDFDPYIVTWAKAIKAVRGPVMIRFAHEMNGYWYPWCGTANGNKPSDFIPAWRHVVNIFKQQGVTNVTWVWSVNDESIPVTYANRYAAYYPGSSYVDWTSISGFNWGATRPYSKNFTFEQLYSSPLSYLRSVKKPVVISEIASVSKGVNKPAWITDMYRRVRLYHHEVKGVVYYDKSETGALGAQNWAIASSSSSLSAYKTATKFSWFLAAPSKTLLPASAVRP